jgi:predicted PurR-regulated permease PerM
VRPLVYFGTSVLARAANPDALRFDRSHEGQVSMRGSGERWQALFYQFVLICSACFALGWLAWRLRLVTGPMFVGFMLAWALRPAVVWLRRHNVPALVALIGPLALVVGLAVVTFAVILPALGSELLRASQTLPERLQEALVALDPITERFIDRRVTDLVAPEVLLDTLQGALRDLAGPARSMVSWILESAGRIVLALANVGLVFIVSAFLMDDYDRLLAVGAELVPPRTRPLVFRVVRRIDETLMGFVRGEMLLFLLATLSFTSGLLVLDVPFAGLVGPVAGIVYLIPYLGVASGVLVALSLALLETPTWGTFAGVTTVFGAFYAIDMLFITPRLIGGRVGLRPLVVLLGIIAGGELLGIAGILLAVPFLAVARILLLESVEAYRLSPIFRGLSAVGEVDAAGDAWGDAAGDADAHGESLQANSDPDGSSDPAP